MKALLIAEAANPDWTSVPLVGWSHARAIMQQIDAHLVTHVRNREAICAQGLEEGKDFTCIDNEHVARPIWKMATILSGGKGKGWTTLTALSAISYYEFERLVWKRFGDQIRKKEFNVVHRITPLSPTTPSLIAKKCHRAGVPFVLGPLNGGVPWPKGFNSARVKEKEWLSYLRSAYKLLPGYRSTLKYASAIIAGSMDTKSQIPEEFQCKVSYFPENGIDPARFSVVRTKKAELPLKLLFVGRLVPYKGADMAIEAAAPLLKSGAAVFEVVGDGPQLAELKELAVKLGVENQVNFSGWVKHDQIQHIMAASDIFVFPSIREFGGAVAMEAMAVGLACVVVRYGGVGEIVSDETGRLVSVGSREHIVSELKRVLMDLSDSLVEIDACGSRGIQEVSDKYVWSRKAMDSVRVYGQAMSSV